MCVPPTLEQVGKARVLCALCGETLSRVEGHKRLYLDVEDHGKNSILYSKCQNGMGGRLTSQLSRDHAIVATLDLRRAVDGDKYAEWREDGRLLGLRRGETSGQIIERGESVHDAYG